MNVTLKDLQGWLYTTALTLHGCENGLVMTARDCREMARMCKRASSLIGAIHDAQQAAERAAEAAKQPADLMVEAAAGGPPPLSPARGSFVDMPEAGPNVVALIPAVPRPQSCAHPAPEESDHA